ncbi:MAG: hypothetical protein ABUT20_62390 [Bacteroidota bacterium]
MIGESIKKYMIAKNEIVKIYETILTVPGMNDEVKVILKTSRRNLLLLSNLIERGLNTKETDEKMFILLDTVSKETLKEISEIPSELLDKAGLTEMNERLKSFKI